MDYIDFALDVDDTLRFSVTIDFANVTVAQAAHAYYETIYSFQATAQRVAERFSLWEHLTWQRQGRRLQARVSLSPQQSQAYAAQYERDTDARILQFMYDEFERQFFENFFASIFYWNFFNSLDMSAGFISKGNNAWSGVGYGGAFYGIPF